MLAIDSVDPTWVSLNVTSTGFFLFLFATLNRYETYFVLCSPEVGSFYFDLLGVYFFGN